MADNNRDHSPPEKKYREPVVPPSDELDWRGGYREAQAVLVNGALARLAAAMDYQSKCVPEAFVPAFPVDPSELAHTLHDGTPYNSASALRVTRDFAPHVWDTLGQVLGCLSQTKPDVKGALKALYRGGEEFKSFLGGVIRYHDPAQCPAGLVTADAGSAFRSKSTPKGSKGKPKTPSPTNGASTPAGKSPPVPPALQRRVYVSATAIYGRMRDLAEAADRFEQLYGMTLGQYLAPLNHLMMYSNVPVDGIADMLGFPGPALAPGQKTPTIAGVRASMAQQEDNAPEDDVDGDGLPADDVSVASSAVPECPWAALDGDAAEPSDGDAAEPPAKKPRL